MKLKKLTIYCLALFCASSSLYAQSGEEVQKKRSGNPIFPGWYADPEGVVLDGKFWIYPTYSAPYDEQWLWQTIRQVLSKMCWASP